jgi:ABC-type molybdate transport system permease subunit
VMSLSIAFMLPGFAVSAAGDPVLSFFIQSADHTTPMLTMIFLYIAAVTAANLCWQIRSKHSSLILWWLVLSNFVFGFILVIFFANRHNGSIVYRYLYDILNFLSPSFAFGSCIYGKLIFDTNRLIFITPLLYLLFTRHLLRTHISIGTRYRHSIN